MGPFLALHHRLASRSFFRSRPLSVTQATFSHDTHFFSVSSEEKCTISYLIVLAHVASGWDRSWRSITVWPLVRFSAHAHFLSLRQRSLTILTFSQSLLKKSAPSRISSCWHMLQADGTVLGAPSPFGLSFVFPLTPTFCHSGNVLSRYSLFLSLF